MLCKYSYHGFGTAIKYAIGYQTSFHSRSFTCFFLFHFLHFLVPHPAPRGLLILVPQIIWQAKPQYCFPHTYTLWKDKVQITNGFSPVANNVSLFQSLQCICLLYSTSQTCHWIFCLSADLLNLWIIVLLSLHIIMFFMTWKWRRRLVKAMRLRGFIFLTCFSLLLQQFNVCYGDSITNMLIYIGGILDLGTCLSLFINYFLTCLPPYLFWPSLWDLWGCQALSSLLFCYS